MPKDAPLPDEKLDDDELLSTVADLIEEIGVGDETEEYVNEVEETLDEDGELEPEQRTKMLEILVALRARKERGDVYIEEPEDEEDDEIILEDEETEDDDGDDDDTDLVDDED